MKKNKLILFDWGNIVEAHTTGYNLYDAYEKLAEDIGYSEPKLFTKTLSKHNWSSISKIDEFKKMYESIKEEYNLNSNFNEFLDKFNHYFANVDFYQDVRDYEISLREKCYIGILSNLGIIEKERLDRQVGLNNYDYIFLSFEMECRKPDDEIYKKVEKTVPFKPEEILFIDDKKENVEKAKQRGWNALQATGLELDKIKQTCEEFINN